MSKVEDFLTQEEEQEIVEAIRVAEKNTSGEIRVHLEKKTSIDAFERAMEVFHLLKMDETELKNGVLIYLAVKDKTFVICGDKGINDVVPNDFWDCTKDVVIESFKSKQFKEGLKKLKMAFNTKKFYSLWAIPNIFIGGLGKFLKREL